MKKNFIQANRQMVSKSKKVEQPSNNPTQRNQPLTLPDKIKNI